MTAKKKAKELVDKFLVPCRKYRTKKPLFSERRQSIQCALICADEISEGIALQTVCHPHLNDYKYWKEVKQEINKL